MGTQSTWGQHSYCVSTKTHYTYTQNMLRFVIGALLLSTTVLGAVQPRVQPNARQFEPQQSELGEWKTVEPQQTEFGEWKIEPQQTEFGEWKVVSQGDNVQGREEFGGNVDLTTPFGGAGINANVDLPAPANNLLTTAVIGLGISSLVNTVATVVIPFFKTDKAPAAVKCVVSEWSECIAVNLGDCGPGIKTRMVTTPASHGGQQCPSPLAKSCEMSKKCPVPVNCKMSDWGECSPSCGEGIKTREIEIEAAHGGTDCPDREIVTESCGNLPACIVPVNCKMSDWGECSASCGEGIKTREIEIEAAHGGTDCPDREIVTESCGSLPACIDD